MPDDRIKFSQLSAVLTINTSDIIPGATENGASETGYSNVKFTIAQLAAKINEAITFSGLETESKYIVPAINEIKELISSIPQFDIQVVQTLPTTGVSGTVYLVPAPDGSSPNMYEEYLWINNSWEKLGSASVDLSNYYNKNQINGMLADVYSTSESYNVGDIVIYNNYLYVCIGATSGAWDSSKWSVVKLSYIIPKDLEDLDNVNIQNPTHRQGLVYDNPSGKWINGSVGGSADITTYDNTESGLSADNVQDAIDELEENIEGITEPQKTVSGSVVTFSDALPNSPLLACKASIEATQSGSGTPSPDNPRPINGFSEVVITANEEDHTISLGQTVGRGVLNVTTGELTITSLIIDNISDYYDSFATGTYSSFYRIRLPKLSTSVTLSEKRNAISNLKFEETAYFGSNRTNDEYSANHFFAINISGEFLAIYDPDNTLSRTDFEAKYSSIEFEYPLATPEVYQLTPEEILTITGENNISANSGDIEVTYRTPFYVSANSTSYDNSTSGLEATNVQQAIDELAYKDIISTLETGETTLTINDSAITTDSTIDIYTDKFGVSPTNQVVTNGQIVLTFTAQNADLGVKVRLS